MTTEINIIQKGICYLFHSLYYNSYVWRNTFWRKNIPLMKNPMDLWIYQQIIFETKPDIIIECGTADGGSAIFMADILEIIGNGKVITIDIEKKKLPEHKRIQYLNYSSTSLEVIKILKEEIKNKTVMVILDSEHTKYNVLKELNIYKDFVTKNNYLILEDTNINGHPVMPNWGEGPKEALEEFLKMNNDFVVDRNREKFLLTFNEGGFLLKK